VPRGFAAGDAEVGEVDLTHEELGTLPRPASNLLPVRTIESVRTTVKATHASGDRSAESAGTEHPDCSWRRDRIALVQ
jgi:hypothetical protein